MSKHTFIATIAQAASVGSKIDTAPERILIMGAGAVECYVEGCLQAAGVDVTLVGKP